MAKKANHGDRISNLPDSVLSRILSSLPTRDAVSTSILSTRWQHLFASIFNLDVDFYISRCYPHIVKSFANFMDKMLFFHSEGRIEQFRLLYMDIPGIDATHVCGWISAALGRGVKEMGLVFHPLNDNSIPMLPTALLFTSNTLVRLKLEIPFVMAVPVHVCLPSLKTLELESIVFEDDDSVERLFSSCPILEDLSISDCDLRNITCIKISNPSLMSLTLLALGEYDSCSYSLTFSIVIDLPNLVYFKYEGYVAKSYSVVNMPCVRADIDISRGHDYTRERDALGELFQGIGNVKSLHLTIYPEALPALSHKRFVAFLNLLELNIFWWITEWKGMELVEFLEFSPNLQTLILANEVSFPMEKVPSCLVYQLKEFKLRGYRNHSSLFEVVTYILKNATVLEKLTMCQCEEVSDKEKFKIAKQLLSIPRNSNKCQVIAF
ncbi:hypothetical protein like AT1G78750 [Hibiscus trionum]|uniref:F-box domain-containing protein n=1 Tax=Hibiscus trionum TaxID=183268 RepID=A0A9W7J2F8_HIBTR|nr:hypothetical protein like AT1G78750 [Hibiscus trionum]